MAAACEIATAVALLPARTAGRLILVAGGAAGFLVAAFPVRSGYGAPVEHILWAVIGLTALSVWSAGASRHDQGMPWALRPGVSAVVTVILLGLLAWFGFELVTSGGQAGLAERVLGEAQSGWPFVVVMSARYGRRPHATPGPRRYGVFSGR